MRETDKNRLEVLMLDYEIAREDDRSTVLVQATLLSVAVAVLAGAAAIITQACAYGLKVEDCAPVPDAVLATIPLAPLAMVAYLQMVGTAGTVRNYYMRAIEQELREHVPNDLSALPGLRAATYTELLTGQISATRGSVSYRFIGFFIVAALLFLFGGLTVYMATGVATGWALGMLAVHGTVAAFIGTEAYSSTLKGRSLFQRLVHQVPPEPNLLEKQDTKTGRSLLSCVVVPRARFDEAVKRLFIPVAFFLGVAARGNWGTVDYGQSLLVWGIYEFLLYDARYQWNDIRNYREDQENEREDRLPHSSLPEGSEGWRQENKRTITVAGLSLAVRFVLAIGLTLLLVDGGLDGQGWVWAIGLVATVCVTATIYEALRGRGAVWPVWIWVGAGYGARATIGLVLAGFALASAEAVLAFVAVAALGIVSVTLTWTLQTMGRCTGRRSGATLRQERRAHLARLLPLAGVSESDQAADPPFDDTPPAEWKIERRVNVKSLAPWEPGLVVAAVTGTALGLLLIENEPSSALLVVAGCLGLAGALLLLPSRRALWVGGATLTIGGPVTVAMLGSPEASDLLSGVPNLILVGLYLYLRSIAPKDLTPDFGPAFDAVRRALRLAILGRSTVDYLDSRSPRG